MVAAVTPEPNGPVARRWLGRQDGGLVVSHWVDVEFAAALSIKVRTRSLSKEYGEIALSRWRTLLAESMFIEPIDPRHFTLASSLAGRPELKLRGGDALHLAIAADRGFALAALDRDLLAAARAVGVRAEQILDT